MLRAIALAGAIFAAAMAGRAVAQQPGSGQSSPTAGGIIGTTAGHIRANSTTNPTGSGCTVDNLSNDIAGSCLASAATGTITFGAVYSVAPFCLFTGYTAAGEATPTTTGLTLSGLTTNARYSWFCIATAYR